MRRPYIGITGFMSRGEVEEVLKSALIGVGNSADQNISNRLIMIGVLASLKTLKGIPNKWPNRYPKPNQLSEIFVNSSLALNLIHYSTKEPDWLLGQLLFLEGLAGPNLDGFQLNITWPSPLALYKYKSVSPNKKIVLQIGATAFEKVNDSPAELARRVKEYEDLVDYLLLDPSGGLGKPFDTEKARAYLRALRESGTNIGLGFAGGLCADSIYLAEPLVSEFHDLSMDAEGKLRNDNDNLNLYAVRKYIDRASLMLSARRA